jgi:hypothetical protein
MHRLLTLNERRRGFVCHRSDESRDKMEDGRVVIVGCGEGGKGQLPRHEGVQHTPMARDGGRFTCESIRNNEKEGQGEGRGGGGGEDRDRGTAAQGTRGRP